jgi:hypothetical protein
LPRRFSPKFGPGMNSTGPSCKAEGGDGVDLLVIEVDDLLLDVASGRLLLPLLVLTELSGLGLHL